MLRNSFGLIKISYICMPSLSLLWNRKNIAKEISLERMIYSTQRTYKRIEDQNIDETKVNLLMFPR